MCVTPAGKIGNCTCGMPKLLPHSGKKSSLLSLFNRSKTVSSHFLFLPLFHPEGSGVLNLCFQTVEDGFEPLHTVPRPPRTDYPRPGRRQDCRAQTPTGNVTDRRVDRTLHPEAIPLHPEAIPPLHASVLGSPLLPK